MVGHDDNEWKPGMSMEELEKRAILRTLEYFAGNKVHAARALGISERSLRTRLIRYGLQHHMKRLGRPRKSA